MVFCGFAFYAIFVGRSSTAVLWSKVVLGAGEA
jgi:hypothetical protein